MSEIDIFDPSDFFDDGATPSVVAVLPMVSGDRKKARDLVKALVRDEELNLEAEGPSSDDHIRHRLNSPTNRLIAAIDNEVKRLSEALEYDGAEGAENPYEARKSLVELAKALATLRTSYVKDSGSQSSSVNLTVDVGGIFNEALNRARETQVPIREITI